MKMNSMVNNSTISPSSSSSSQQFNHHMQQQIQGNHHFGLDPTDDFLDHMLSSVPPSPWSDLADSTTTNPNKSNDGGGGGFPGFDESAVLAAKLRQHQISPAGAAVAKLMLQQQLLMSVAGGGGGDTLLDGSPFKSPPPGGETSMEAIFNGFTSGSQQNFPHHPQSQNIGGTMGQGSGSTSGGAGQQQPKQQRVRARRGQATDPHSIAERLRRERIAERMKSLQELVPNANKTDKASMLDEIIDYVKFLQLQVKVLSMSRLGGAAPISPLLADEKRGGGGAGECFQAGNGGSVLRNGASSGCGGGENNMTMTEQQVAKLMEEDMGSAMQYLQGKGLCLMPISLATAISTATCQARTSSINNNTNSGNQQQHLQSNGGGEGPPSPNMSALTVQSANVVGKGAGDGSVSKP